MPHTPRRRSLASWGFKVSKLPNSDAAHHNERSTQLHDVLDAYKVKADKEAVDNAPWYIIRPVSSFMAGWDGVTSTKMFGVPTHLP